MSDYDDQPFGGTVGRYHWESTPWWPDSVRPPDGAPNIVIVVLDDVGFAQLGCFGSDIDTPTFDRLAANGLRYTNFHTTALCSPTRAALLTGHNHHSVGMGRLTELAAGFPGYHARIPRSCAFLPAMLTPHGYAAWALGKWHLTPDDEAHAAGTRRRWPLSRGFERFYGYFEGETHQFAPALVDDNHLVHPPGRFEDGYHLTEDLVDHGIELVRDLRSVDPAKPFLLYLATGACHSPHQAPVEWVERYRGRFDQGWDRWREKVFARQQAEGLLPPTTQLSPRPDWVPAWEDLDDDHRTVFARYMEAFAAYLSHTDHHIGRLVAALEESGDLADTVIVVLSDNGASSEGGVDGSLNDVRVWNGMSSPIAEALARLDEIGGPRIHNNYPWGWTVAGNTPFRRWKREVHEGGVADPLIVHWPAGISGSGTTRDQYVHVSDILPTLLDIVGIPTPEVVDAVMQRPLDGLSFATTLNEPDAPAVRDTQYFEMFACRAIYHDGWKAVTYHPVQAAEPGIDQVQWELYHVAEDRSECNDLASVEPERLATMEALWWQEAERHHVLPLDNRPLSELTLGRPFAIPDLPRYVYYPGAMMIPEHAAANVKNRHHRVTARLTVPPTGAEGVILAQGSYLGGWSLYLLDGRVRYAHNLAGRRVEHVGADQPLQPGAHTVILEVAPRPAGGADVTIEIDGELAADGEIRRLVFSRYSLTGAGLTCGYGLAPAVTDEYRAPFGFTGELAPVQVDLAGPIGTDPAEVAGAAIATQ